MAAHSINISYQNVQILEYIGTVLSHIEDKINKLPTCNLNFKKKTVPQPPTPIPHLSTTTLSYSSPRSLKLFSAALLPHRVANS